MMNVRSINQGLDQPVVKLDRKILALNAMALEPVLEMATGTRSAAKLEAFYGVGGQVTVDTLAKFSELWPHIDNLGRIGWWKGRWKYIKDGRLAGVENEREAERKFGKPDWL